MVAVRSLLAWRRSSLATCCGQHPAVQTTHSSSTSSGGLSDTRALHPEADTPSPTHFNTPTHTQPHHQVCAAKGLDVLLMDRSKELLDHGLTGIKKSLRRLNEKGSITKEAASEALGRISTETTLDVSWLGSWCLLQCGGRGSGS